jgi:PTH1 family peptidyl-tRNA hydrolase
MKIIVGLGNSGKQYQFNRHNVGFRCIDYLADLHAISVRKSICQSNCGKGIIAGIEVLLVKPKTFVNLSGISISCLMEKYESAIEDLIVIYDDLDLPTGRIRIRHGGRSAGHRGIKSIIKSISNTDFYRIRIGISKPDRETSGDLNEDAVVEYVLGNFTQSEEKIIQQAVRDVAEAVECILARGISNTMNKFNRRSPE